MMCTRCVSAASAASRTVAAGTVKSMIASAASASGRTSLVTIDAVRRQAGEHAGILAEQRRALAFRRAGERQARRLGDRLDQRAPHAPAGAGHDQPHVWHRCSGLPSRYSGRCAPMSARLRAVIALDDHDIAGRMRRAQLDGAPDIPASCSRRARSRSPGTRSRRCASGVVPSGFSNLPAAHQKLRAEFRGDGSALRRHVGLVAVRVAAHRHARSSSPSACACSLAIARPPRSRRRSPRAAAFGSARRDDRPADHQIVGAGRDRLRRAS